MNKCVIDFRVHNKISSYELSGALSPIHGLHVNLSDTGNLTTQVLCPVWTTNLFKLATKVWVLPVCPEHCPLHNGQLQSSPLRPVWN